MTMFGNALIIGGGALIGASIANNLNVAQIPPGIAAGAGMACIGIGTAFELLG